MKRKVKITQSPRFKQATHSGDQTPPHGKTAKQQGGTYDSSNNPEIKINETLQPTSRENSTLEAELGETVVTDLQGDGIPEFYKIAGKRHSQGGTPLNLPEDSFIYSRDNKMKIYDPEVLNMFGKKGKKPKAATPAELSKNFNLNKYRAILMDPNSDRLSRETAEMMITNYNIKLGGLALAQESIKGFQADIPKVAMPYIETLGIDPSTFVSPEPPPGLQEQVQAQASQDLGMFRNGGAVEIPKFKKGGAKRNKRRARVIKAPVTSARPTRKLNIPENAVIWDPSQENYERGNVKPGDYIKKDGKYVKVTGFSSKPYEGDYANEKLGKLSDDFGLLRNKIQQPEIKKEIARRYREEIKTKKPNAKTGLTQEDLNTAAGLSDDEIIEKFLQKEEQVYALANQHKNADSYDKGDKWDKGKTRHLHTEKMKELGYEKLPTSDVASFQQTYAVVQKMADDPKYKTEFKDFNVGQIGLADEQGAGTGKSTVSNVDGWDGNTTSGQIIAAKDSEMMTEDVPFVDDKEPVEKTKLRVAEDVGAPGGMFLQDKIKIGNSAYDLLTAQKEEPWRPSLTYTPVAPALTDFRGTAARISAGTQGALEQASTFAGPQAFAAMAANISRTAVDPLLKTQNAEYSKNQDVINKFALYNNQNLNQFNKENAAWQAEGNRDQRAADKEFRNTKNQLKDRMVANVITGIDNAVAADYYNDVTPNYQINPRSGGHGRFVAGIPEDFGPTNNNFDPTQAYQVMKNANPNLSEGELSMLFQNQYGKPSDKKNVPPMMQRAAPPNYNDSYRYNRNAARNQRPSNPRNFIT